MRVDGTRHGEGPAPELPTTNVPPVASHLVGRGLPTSTDTTGCPEVLEAIHAEGDRPASLGLAGCCSCGGSATPHTLAAVVAWSGIDDAGLGRGAGPRRG